MRAVITGLEQGDLEVEFLVLPREGEYLKLHNKDDIIEGKVASVTHSIYLHQSEHQIKIALKPIN